MTECVIELEVLVFDEFRDAVDLVPAVVDDDVGVGDGDDVDDATRQLLRENRSLFYAHIDLQLVSGDMLHTTKNTEG